MRYYLIDEISPDHIKTAKDFLKETALSSGIESIFWVSLPHDLLTGSQYEHTGCRPHVFAVETGPSWIKFELFIRSLTTMRCTCPSYCSKQQAEFILNFAEAMIAKLGIRT
ncbi:MAG: hypothetical protein C4582_03900 [Desulfobacteraceae bacterium]|jgi:hypothetical protein|nr:MAG: hypothetical protein C4582_03900 [Desulfobacteraceae bacterium]